MEGLLNSIHGTISYVGAEADPLVWKFFKNSVDGVIELLDIGEQNVKAGYNNGVSAILKDIGRDNKFLYAVKSDL